MAVHRTPGAHCVTCSSFTSGGTLGCHCCLRQLPQVRLWSSFAKSYPTSGSVAQWRRGSAPISYISPCFAGWSRPSALGLEASSWGGSTWLEPDGGGQTRPSDGEV